MMADSRLKRIVRAPFFMIGLLFSFIPATFIFAVVTVGTWIEMAIYQAKLPMPSDTALMVIGIAAYSAIGIAIPIYVGNFIGGWMGAVALPLVVLALIAIVDRW